MPFDLIIWDCDGCLLDSELLSCASAAGLLRSEGVDISDNEFVDRYLGWRWTDIYTDIETRTGRDVRESLPYHRIDSTRRRLFESSLKNIPFVVEVMDKIDLPSCIASGSEMERLEHSMKITGLWNRFERRVFTAHDVERGKPAPDVFLYAASKMTVKPSRCLVIEDAAHGIVAAQAAGMAVFAFTGGSHIRPDLVERLKAEKPDAIFDDMRQLPELIAGHQAGSA